MVAGVSRPHAGVVIADWFEGLFSTLDAAPLWQLCLGVGLLLVLETTVFIGLLIPGEVVLLASATTVDGPGEFVALASTAAAASLLGQSGGYLLGRRFGAGIRRSWLGRRIGAASWARAEDMLRGGTGRAIIGSRFLAVAHSLVPMLAGTLRMRGRRFAVYTLAGAVVWGIVYVALGGAASVALRHGAHLLGPVLTGVLGTAAAAFLVVRAGRSRRRARRSPRLVEKNRDRAQV